MFGRKGIESPRYGTGTKLYVYSSDTLELISFYISLRTAGAAMRAGKSTLKAYAKSGEVFRYRFILSFEPSPLAVGPRALVLGPRGTRTGRPWCLRPGLSILNSIKSWCLICFVICQKIDSPFSLTNHLT
jgi:hypothetical protein